jgi:transcriptional regulator with XRE-family HTH domain
MAEPGTILNQNIRAEMARRSVLQADLAQAIGMSQPALSRRLSGQADWNLLELFAAAQHLGVRVADLLPEVAA